MSGPPEVVLLGDVGATNARFALLINGKLGPIQWIEVAHHPTFGEAIENFLQGTDQLDRVARAVLAVAGPVAGEQCAFTNCKWTIDSQDTLCRFGLESVRLVNDFQATALSLPHLTDQDVRAIGEGRAVADAPLVVLGPGSGLGVAALVPSGTGDHVVIASEGGHATMAATSVREDAVLDRLRRQFGHVSAERVLSGPGMENLYAAIAELDEITVPTRTAADITFAALKGSCPVARAALEMFCAMLGAFAGNVALTYGASGGVFIAGGIAPRILDFLAQSEFRARFEQKGRLSPYLKEIPTQVIVHPAATFLGLRSILAKVQSFDPR